MNEVNQNFEQVRSRICNFMLVVSAVFAAPAAAASVYRSVAIGWQPVMGLHIAVPVILWALWLYRGSIPYKIRASTLVFVFLVIGLIGFWNFGMIAGANPMLIIAPVLATILFEKKLGIFFTIATVLTMALTAYSFVYGGRVMNVDFVVHGTYLPSWITHVLAVILTIATAIVGISMGNSHLIAALQRSRQSETKLSRMNKDLEAKVLERTLKLEAAKKDAEHQARTDVLTGLRNRRAFFEQAHDIDAQARRYDHRYVIMTIDIDHFKVVNDSWGHDAGNSALVSVAQVISQALRETDVVGRIGGEEFAAILPETVINEGSALAERLRSAIEAAVITTPKGEIKITVSIGLASLCNLSDTLDRIVSNSDTALYQAKNAGRNRVELHQG